MFISAKLYIGVLIIVVSNTILLELIRGYFHYSSTYLPVTRATNLNSSLTCPSSVSMLVLTNVKERICDALFCISTHKPMKISLKLFEER